MLSHIPIKLNNLLVIGSIEQLKEALVEEFERTWIAPRISYLYDKIKWTKNEVPFWVRKSEQEQR